VHLVLSDVEFSHETLDEVLELQKVGRADRSRTVDKEGNVGLLDTGCFIDSITLDANTCILSFVMNSFNGKKETNCWIQVE